METVHLRSELLAVEMQEERERLLLLAIVMVALAVVGLMTFLSLNALLLIVFWDHRVIVATTMLGVYGLSFAGLGGLVWWWVKNSPIPFAETLNQLRRDRAAIGRD
jgi:uncharacterized membrane protein YqjE